MDEDLHLSFSENRSRFYWFLSDFYNEKPTVEFLSQLKSKISSVTISAPDALSESILCLHKILQDDDFGGLSERLLKEYTRLMRGVKSGYGPAPPYESVYRGERRVGGEVTLEVTKFYQAAGFGFDYPGPKDYLGVELRFMAFLAHEELSARKDLDTENIERWLRLQERFLQRHLLMIVPEHSRKVIQDSKEVFYVEVAKVTDRYITQDLENLRFLLREVVK